MRKRWEKVHVKFFRLHQRRVILVFVLVTDILINLAPTCWSAHPLFDVLTCRHYWQTFVVNSQLTFREGIPPLTVATWKSLRQVPHAQSRRRPCYPRANSEVNNRFETCLTEEMWMHLNHLVRSSRKLADDSFFFFIKYFISNPLWKNNCRACTNKSQSRHSIVLNIQIFCKYFYPDITEVRMFARASGVWCHMPHAKN